MFIALLDFHTSPTDRDVALAQLDSDRDEVRGMPGNLNFRVFGDRDNEESITVVHEWDDEQSFAGYLASDAFARLGAVIRPLMTAAPVSRRFHADLLETV